MELLLQRMVPESQQGEPESLRPNLACLSCSPPETMKAQETVSLFTGGEVCELKSIAMCLLSRGSTIGLFPHPLLFNVGELSHFLPRPASMHSNNSGGNK